MSEQTLCIIKPDAVQRNLTGEILAHIESSGLRLRAMKMVQLTLNQAQGFYQVHKDKPFFQSLTQYMCSGPAVVAILEGENAVQHYRQIMGATNPEQAEEGTIRRKYALDIERNSVHGSDSPENASIEVNYFFNQLEVIPV
ncbi:MAG: nucleoside-diphosphate kinase [Desulfohalobiaceae bacterium]